MEKAIAARGRLQEDQTRKVAWHEAPKVPSDAEDPQSQDNFQCRQGTQRQRWVDAGLWSETFDMVRSSVVI